MNHNGSWASINVGGTRMLHARTAGNSDSAAIVTTVIKAAAWVLVVLILTLGLVAIALILHQAQGAATDQGSAAPITRGGEEVAGRTAGKLQPEPTDAQKLQQREASTAQRHSQVPLPAPGPEVPLEPGPRLDLPPQVVPGPAVAPPPAHAAEPPPPPAKVTATVLDSQTFLEWDACPGATAYNVWRGIGCNGEGAIPYREGIRATSLWDVAPANGGGFYYRITAVGEAGQSAPSLEAAAKDDETSITVPQDATARLACGRCCPGRLLGLTPNKVLFLCRSQITTSQAQAHTEWDRAEVLQITTKDMIYAYNRVRGQFERQGGKELAMRR